MFSFSLFPVYGDDNRDIGFYNDTIDDAKKYKLLKQPCKLFVV